MKSQDILRPSGGADIKLKDKEKNMKRLAETAALLLLVLAACFGIYYFVDYIWNGSFVNWFQDNYMWTRMGTDHLSGQDILISEVNCLNLRCLF